MKKRKLRSDSAAYAIKEMASSYAALPHPKSYFDLNEEARGYYYATLQAKPASYWSAPALVTAVNLSVLDVAIAQLNSELIEGVDLNIVNPNTDVTRANPIITSIATLNSARNTLTTKLKLNGDAREPINSASALGVAAVQQEVAPAFKAAEDGLSFQERLALRKKEREANQ